MNEHVRRATAAWANPKDEHHMKSSSREYVTRQLRIAATLDDKGPGAELLNKESISAQTQTLAKFRQHDELLELPADIKSTDLEDLIDTIYRMDLFDFSEYYDFEEKKRKEQTPSKEEVEYLAGVLIGKFSNYCKLCVPNQISSKDLYYHLDRLYCFHIASRRESDRNRTQRLPNCNQLPAPAYTNIPPNGANKRIERLPQQRSIWARAWSCVTRFKF